MKTKTLLMGGALLLLLAVISGYCYISHGESKERSPVKVKEPKKEEAIVPGEKGNIEKETVRDTNTDLQQQKVPDAGENHLENILKNFVVVIDPGHQRKANLGKEPVGPGAGEMKMKVSGGTSGTATRKPEYQLTLEASLVLADLLEKKGVKVVLTRTANDVNLSNRERAEIANRHHADLFIRIHADGSTNRNVRGLSVLTPSNDSPYTKAIYQDSLQASKFILSEAEKNPAVKVNGISYRGDLSGFNWSKVPCTLVEMGFMSNPAEDRNLSDPVYLQKLQANIVDGIIKYAEYKQ
ncbi:N-acetylmuramoyl-L-alanine amidase [Neobacillus mesonae]|uniref:N-acetylmuramoyl-L-alanine amidase family protein n=1 Tax=Neobacillus mesonae TaxID=1193713 RepID=UPI00203B7B66|nr:N-acetylmuramoyl-L-alanine amidase [Neobacillus mesonae]MCM3568995.1 N-acetylmuramoyl-L-alanine amidase [Neobacillus mesonae]